MINMIYYYDTMPICKSAAECAKLFPLTSIINIENFKYKVSGYLNYYDGTHYWWPIIGSNSSYWNLYKELSTKPFSVEIDEPKEKN